MENKALDYFKGDELAANVWQSKYAAPGEQSPDEMHRRLAKEFARVEAGYIKKETDKTNLSEYGKTREDLTEDRIYELFKDFRYIVPQGSVMATLGTDVIASLSNCWVLPSPYDSYPGILKTDGDLVGYYKRRGGVGVNISTLRPRNASTNNTAKTTTGAVSFMDRFSNTTREVAMNGRRGALMLSIHINHPDVLEFIKIKSDKTKVTGANISVQVTDEFIGAVKEGKDFILRFPIDTDLNSYTFDNIPYNELQTVELDKNPVFIKKIKAKEYWDELITQAKDNAEPGVMYWDRVLDYDPASVYSIYKPENSNPCGEQFLNANDSCRLMAYNLLSFVDNPYTPKAKFNFPLWYKTVYEGTKLGDTLVDLEAEYIDRIINKIKSDPEPSYIKAGELKLWEDSKNKCISGRRMGMGITAMGDTLASLGLPYDSDEGINVIEKIMKEKTKAELDCSIDLSILRGPFTGWDSQIEYPDNTGANTYYTTLEKEFPEQVNRMRKYGRRNVNISTIAPTGSVSILTQTTSGIEPLFKAYYIRRKKINPGEEGVRVDFVDKTGDSWQEFPVLHPQFKEWIRVEYKTITDEDISIMTPEVLQDFLSKSPWYGSEAEDIDWIKRVEIQSVAQKYVSNAISSTLNLPSTVTHEKVSEIYMKGWELGLKGQTVYVDGSRSGVLVSSADQGTKEEFPQRSAPKRPKELPCFAHKSISKGIQYSVIVGLLDNKPYELFITEGAAYGNGVIKKVKRGHYIFEKTDTDKPFSEDITANMSLEQSAVTRLASGMLRHGADVKYVMDQLDKCSGNMFDFTGSLKRVLSKYVKGESGAVCPSCGEESLIMEEGCKRCTSCGFSACS